MKLNFVRELFAGIVVGLGVDLVTPGGQAKEHGAEPAREEGGGDGGEVWEVDCGCYFGFHATQGPVVGCGRDGDGKGGV